MSAEQASLTGVRYPSKLVFVNRFFDPDTSATSQILTDLARGLVERGFVVHVICSCQLYTDPGARLPARECLSGVMVHRVSTTRFGRAGLVGRAIDYASFYLTAGAALLELLDHESVVIAKTDPPLISILAAIVARLKGSRLVNWQQDVFPEIASRLAASSFPMWLDAALQKLRDWSMRSAKMNVLIGSRMREYFRNRGLPESKLCVIENWADAGKICPTPAGDSALRHRLGLSSRFVACYSGNLGRAHEYDTILAAATVLRADDSIVFLMIGGGVNMELLRRAASESGLTNILFLPYQPRDELNDSLAAADVHLASLLPDLEGLIMPSKIYGILAAGRPLVFIGDRDGEVARVIDAAGCGATVDAGAGSELAAMLRRLQSEPGTRDVMGACARAALVNHLSMDKAIARWVEVLDG